MPFGLTNDLATFNRIMQKILEGLEHTDSLLNDILFHTEGWDEHLSKVRLVLRILRNTNLTSKPSKCIVGYSNMEYLGISVG